VQELISV